MAPRVLVSDELSETAVQIFRDRGVEVDYMPKLGKDKEKLAEIIGQYDGLAIRSATKVTEKLLEQWKEAEKTAFKPDEIGDGDTPIRIIDTGE